MYYPYVKSQHPFRVLDGGPEGIVSADLLIWGMADIADQVAGDSVTKHRHIVELHNTPWGRFVCVGGHVTTPLAYGSGLRDLRSRISCCSFSRDSRRLPITPKLCVSHNSTACVSTTGGVRWESEEVETSP
eukprot:1083542-Prorocentrum_minimum.AAC.3